MKTASLALLSAGMIAIVGIASCESNRGGAASSSAGAKRSDAWRDTFSIDRSKLVPRGGSSFFSLDPGAVSTFKDEGALLTITVLNETIVIDGVTTRIIEEREEENGRLKEVSRNYFAADPATGDVYYFGEDVDIYEQGKIANHGGAWRSGVNGARFGLILPARPGVGARYYQEIAPGIAMDRAEVVGVEERVTTPAGVFEHCLHTKETTPIERDVGHKWYAPGVGLVKDGEVMLVSHTGGKS